MTVHLALPTAVRDVISPSLLELYDVRWYGDFEQALDVAPDVEAMWLRPADIPLEHGRRLISKSRNLQWLHVSRVGVEVLPLDRMAELSIVLTNGAGLTSEAIAEHVIMCTLALRRGLPALLQAQSNAAWSPGSARGDRVDGCSALVVGYGHVGRAVVRRMRSLGMNVMAARQRRTDEDEDFVLGGDWRERLPEVDVLVLALPLTSSSKDLVGRKELGLLKPGAAVISVSRGEVLDVACLTGLILEGRLGGAALDCFEEEPLPPSSPLWELPNTMITPHVAWKDSGFVPREIKLFDENARKFIQREPLVNVVDLRVGY